MSKRELSIPDGAAHPDNADRSVELMRVWWVGPRPEYVLRPALNDPKDIGRMLGEAAYHWAQVYASHGDGEPGILLDAIYEGIEESKKIRMTAVINRTSPGKG